MDVDTEASLPCVTSRDHRFASAKRPRTDETSQHHCPVNSRDGFHQHESENGLFSKRSDASQMPAGSSWQGCRRFLTIHAGCSIFESEDCRPKGETLYTPLREDVIINTRNIEQFTFANGSFFIGDESSRFRKTVQGVCLNMWRFDSETKKLYISRSFVFSNPQVVQKRLRNRLSNKILNRLGFCQNAPWPSKDPGENTDTIQEAQGIKRILESM